MGDFDFSYSFSYSIGSYDTGGGFNSIGGSGYAGQNVTYQATTSTGFDAFTSNPFVTDTTTTGFTLDTSIVGSANYQIGVDYTNNAVTGFANPNTGGTQALSLDNTYYTLQSGSDAYLTSQFNTLGSIAVIQTETATVIANSIGVGYDDTYDYAFIDNDVGTVINGASAVTNLNVAATTGVSAYTGTTDNAASVEVDIGYGITVTRDSFPNDGGNVIYTAAGLNTPVEYGDFGEDLSYAAQARRETTTDDPVAYVTSIFQEIINESVNARAGIISEAVGSELAYQSGTTNERIVGPGLGGNSTTIDLVEGKSFVDLITSTALAIEGNDPAVLAALKTGLPNPFDYGFNLDTGIFASEEDAALYGQARVDNITNLLSVGFEAVITGYQVGQQYLRSNPDTFTLLNADGTFEVLPYTLQSQLKDIDDPIISQAILRAIAEQGGNIGRADLSLSNLERIADQYNIQAVIDENITADNTVVGDTSGNPTGAGGDFVPFNSLTNAATDQPVDQGIAVSETDSNTVVNVDLTASQPLTKTIRDSLGWEPQGPVVENLITRAINLALNQLPGYSAVNNAVGTVNQALTVNDIVTNTNLSIGDQALALARLLIPQVDVAVRVFNLVAPPPPDRNEAAAERQRTLQNAAAVSDADQSARARPVPQRAPQSQRPADTSDPAVAAADIPFTSNTIPQGFTLVRALDTTVANANLILSNVATSNANLTLTNAVTTLSARAGNADPTANTVINTVAALATSSAVANRSATVVPTLDPFASLSDQALAELNAPVDLSNLTLSAAPVANTLAAAQAAAQARINSQINQSSTTSSTDPLSSIVAAATTAATVASLVRGISTIADSPYATAAADIFGGGAGDTDGFAAAATAAASSSNEAATILAATQRAQSQAAIEAQRGQADNGDWRVKLRLAGDSDYLYNDPDISQDGILYPLYVTGGVVFPYTPSISTTYGANYSSYDLTHSNYRGQFYQNSYVDDINIQATFTAQDTSEANYLLAVIHFFRSVTKMFYGLDAQRGAPPPLVFLQGLGEYQFNLHPCVVKSFNYNLPADVDYIRARTANINGTNLLQRRDRQTLPTSSALGSFLRLANATLTGLPVGALAQTPAPQTLGTSNPTYVPTKLDMTITLTPIQTRDQVSKQFSLKGFANGDLLKGGFW